jgi:hypothetical protein
VPYVRARDNPATLEETKRVAIDVAATISARLGFLPEPSKPRRAMRQATVRPN